MRIFRKSLLSTCAFTGAPGAGDGLTLSAGIGFNLSNGANLDLNYKGALALDGNGTSHAVMSRFSRSF